VETVNQGNLTTHTGRTTILTSVID